MTLDAEDERRTFAFTDHLDVGVRPVARPLVPARVLAAALLVVTVLAVTPALLGHRTGTVSAFGPARNGLIAWAIDGDIVVGDPSTGTTNALVAAPGLARNPVFSPDGARLAFLRQVRTDQGGFDLFVSGADGSGPVMLSAVPMPMPDAVEWAPDSRSLLVEEKGVSLLQGHTHRFGAHARTTVDGRILVGIENFSMCSRRQTYVSHPNWQLGFSVVYFLPGAGRFQWFPIVIGADYRFVWRGKEYGLEGVRRMKRSRL